MKDWTFPLQQWSCHSDVRPYRTKDKPELLDLFKLYPKKTLVSREGTISLGFSKILLSLQIMSCENYHLSVAAVSIVSKQM